MDLYILDADLNTLSVVDDASSILWTRRYCGIGEFEFTISTKSPYTKYISVNNYVKRENDNHGGIIESINHKSDFEDGDYILVRGRLLESILDRRIVWYQTYFRNITAEDAIRQFVYQNSINDSIRPRRNIPGLVLGSHNGFNDTITIQRTGTNLDELVQELCQKYGYGFRIIMDNKLFIFELYKGVDRSYAQNENSFVVFSEELDNLMANEYLYSFENYKNVNLVAGEGEGIERRTVAVGSHMIPINVNDRTEWDVDISGLDRREKFTDARDASSNMGEISTEEYEEQLISRGLGDIEGITQVFDADVELSSTYRYKRDFDVGDIVTVKSEKWGVYINTRLEAMTESEDVEGYKLVPTFTN